MAGAMIGYNDNSSVPAKESWEMLSHRVIDHLPHCLGLLRFLLLEVAKNNSDVYRIVRATVDSYPRIPCLPTPLASKAIPTVIVARVRIRSLHMYRMLKPYTVYF